MTRWLVNCLRPRDVVDFVKIRAMTVSSGQEVVVVSVPAAAYPVGVARRQGASYSWPVRIGTSREWMEYQVMAARFEDSGRSRQLAVTGAIAGLKSVRLLASLLVGSKHGLATISHPERASWEVVGIRDDCLELLNRPGRLHAISLTRMQFHVDVHASEGPLRIPYSLIRAAYLERRDLGVVVLEPDVMVIKSSADWTLDTTRPRHQDDGMFVIGRG